MNIGKRILFFVKENVNKVFKLYFCYIFAVNALKIEISMHCSVLPKTGVKVIAYTDYVDVLASSGKFSATRYSMFPG